MNFESARSFIYRNARPLDLARWRYLFEDGDRELVLTALAAYQNGDGGFGHGLEADCWNPESAPVQIWTATQILREAGLDDVEHPIVQGILRYLASGAAFDGHVWLGTLPSNDAHPHAPWWNYDPEQAWGYNPTASLIGFILRCAKRESSLYALAVRLAGEAYGWFRAHAPLESMHTAACFVEFYEDLRECAPEGVELDEFEALLRAQLQHVLTRDPDAWAREYVCKPSLFIHDRKSPFYEENRALCALECAFIAETQLADGSFRVTWDWGCGFEQWAVAKNWWKSDLILKNAQFSRAMEG